MILSLFRSFSILPHSIMTDLHGHVRIDIVTRHNLIPSTHCITTISIHHVHTISLYIAARSYSIMTEVYIRSFQCTYYNYRPRPSRFPWTTSHYSYSTYTHVHYMVRLLHSCWNPRLQISSSRKMTSVSRIRIALAFTSCSSRRDIHLAPAEIQILKSNIHEIRLVQIRRESRPPHSGSWDILFISVRLSLCRVKNACGKRYCSCHFRATPVLFLHIGFRVRATPRCHRRRET